MKAPPSIAFKCPSCKQELEADRSMVGEMIDCPSCKNTFTIPPQQASGAATIPSEQRVVIVGINVPFAHIFRVTFQVFMVVAFFLLIIGVVGFLLGFAFGH